MGGANFGGRIITGFGNGSEFHTEMSDISNAGALGLIGGNAGGGGKESL